MADNNPKIGEGMRPCFVEKILNKYPLVLVENVFEEWNRYSSCIPLRIKPEISLHNICY